MRAATTVWTLVCGLIVVGAIACTSPTGPGGGAEPTPTPEPVSGNGDFSEPLSTAEPDGNGNLDTGGSWAFYLNSGGNGSAQIESGELHVVVTDSGTTDWAVQLLQAPVLVERGGTYHISFAGRSSTDGMRVVIKVGGTAERSWTAYYQNTFTLTTTMETYEVDFTMELDTDENARFEVWFLDTGDYWLDDIYLVKTGQEELPTEGTLTEADEDQVESWQLVWQEEFDGPSIDTSIWNFEIGNGHAQGIPGWGNNELQYYKQENAFIENGVLVIEAREEQVSDEYGTYDYTSARMTTKGKYEFQYGRVEIRAKLPYGQGIWPALWMLGSDIDTTGWPSCGEIDIMELIGSVPNVVHGTVHGPVSQGPGVGSGYTLESGTFADDFHVFAIEWDPDEVEFYVDDQLYHVVNKDEIGSDWVFDHPFFFILNVAVGGNWPGAPDDTTVFPQRMEVDYIRVYEDTNPDSIDGQEKWDCDYEIAWQEPVQIDQVTATEDPEFYLIAEDPGLVDVVMDWDPNTLTQGAVMPDVWGSGSTYDAQATYNGKNCWSVTPGTGWGISGGVLAFMGDIYDGTKVADFPADIATYTSIKLTLALPADFDPASGHDIHMKLAGSEKEISILPYLDTATTDWQQVTVPLSAFGTPSEIAGSTQIAIFTLGSTQPYYIAEWRLSANS
ncbi:family 16 glycosylhydrolase [Spirochaeta thermophila]|uniref:Laminarinase n=1 Tax=Winmispira thermophila (strain ATCC 49972 / DSM 6192 / RI 19.B1) TaxID=665571 RepID=E0RUA3_WINT6|nr:family 16 glycosylhydrolase [Spirochaeta thermophila]ADN02324.1 laminarinase [Spirochaeta thermophila DSM 6192]